MSKEKTIPEFKTEADEHRIIYKVEVDSVFIAQVRYHY